MKKSSTSNFTGVKRRRRVLRDNIQGITKPDIRRMARRAGIKRMSGTIYDETRQLMKGFMMEIIRDAVIYSDHANRSTVTPMDVAHSLKRQGMTLYM